MNRIQFLDLKAINDRIRPELNAAWNAVLAHGILIGGPEVDQFEREFAEYCGVSGCSGSEAVPMR